MAYSMGSSDTPNLMLADHHFVLYTVFLLCVLCVRCYVCCVQCVSCYVRRIESPANA